MPTFSGSTPAKWSPLKIILVGFAVSFAMYGVQRLTGQPPSDFSLSHWWYGWDDHLWGMTCGYALCRWFGEE